MFKKNKKDKDVRIKKEESSLKEFVARPIPSEEEVEEFEERIEEVANETLMKKNYEIREGAIEEGLNEIYQDEGGKDYNVKKLDIKKKRGFVFLLLSFVFVLAIFGGVGYGVYYYLFKSGSDVADVSLKIEGSDQVIAGQEFFYTVTYNNLSNVSIGGLRLELTYPGNFIFLDSSPAASINNNIWNLSDLSAHGSNQIKIKGKIIDMANKTGMVQGVLFYTPSNITSEFRKDYSYTSVVTSSGINISVNYPSTVLIGENSEATLNIQPQKRVYLNNFNITVGQLDDVQVSDIKIPDSHNSNNNTSASSSAISIKKINDNTWSVSNFSDQSHDIVLVYKVTAKKDDNIIIPLTFSEDVNGQNQEFIFDQENISQQVMKSDLNLSIAINGSKNDQSVNFGDTLNYSINYINKGENSMKDLVIMAVLDSDFLERATLNDKNNGQEKGDTITWTKNEIPQLAELNSNDSGEIDFSVQVSKFNEADLGKNFQIKSYVQYSLGDSNGATDNHSDNISNTITNQINSDLNLSEQIMYFSNDNIPVGTGPLPPKVGQATSFKVYWTVTNNLHELSNVVAKVILPNGVNWNEKDRTSVGTIQYDPVQRQVTWNIGRMPITVYRADAEFSIVINPQESDKDTIMVLSPGSTIQGTDNITGGNITKTTKTQTTKLDDDVIAKDVNNGVVE